MQGDATNIHYLEKKIKDLHRIRASSIIKRRSIANVEEIHEIEVAKDAVFGRDFEKQIKVKEMEGELQCMKHQTLRQHHVENHFERIGGEPSTDETDLERTYETEYNSLLSTGDILFFQ